MLELKMLLKLTNYPIPPTSNKLYSSSRGRLIKSKVGREFDDKIEFYALINKRKIEAIKADILKQGLKTLKIGCTFVFHKSRVISQKGKIKRLDASNRLKQVHDSLSKLIGIDDSYFVELFARKATCNDPKDEQVIITIESGSLLDFDDL